MHPEGNDSPRVVTHYRLRQTPMARFVKRLLDRRVPQILGAYLGCSWGVIEFMTLIVDRYLLSPHLADFTIALLALFVPSACLLAWNHGPPGNDEWTRTETVGLSLSGVGVFSFVVLFLLFGAKAWERSQRRFP